MAIEQFTLNTDAKDFALVSKQAGATALNAFSSSNADQEKIRQIPAWSENLWPLPDGRMNAVVQQKLDVPALPEAVITANASNRLQIFTVNTKSKVSYAVFTQDAWLAYTVGGWVTIHTPSSFETPSVYSLNGESWMHASAGELYQFDPAAIPGTEFQAITVATVTGLDTTLMLSSCSALNYRIFADGDTIYWSAPLDSLYFTPGGSGAQAGAGNTKLQDANSSIQFVLGAEDGFYIFCATNIIKATYTRNPLSPWVFKTVTNSAGVVLRQHVFLQNRLNDTYIWSRAGFANLTPSQMNLSLPQLTELLSGDVYEEYDHTTKDVEVVSTGVEYDVQIVYTGKRLVCVSYAPTGVQRKYIIVLDTVTRQVARLNIPHLAIYDVVRLQREGKIFDDWTEDFDDSLETFADMITSEDAIQFQAVALGIIAPDGQMYRITPIDIFTGGVGSVADAYTVLPNVTLFRDIRRSRTRSSDLIGVVLNNSYPTYSKDGNPNQCPYDPNSTQLLAYSEVDPTIRQYQRRPPLNEGELFTEYVEKVQGNRIHLALENIGSTLSVEVKLKQAGRVW